MNRFSTLSCVFSLGIMGFTPIAPAALAATQAEPALSGVWMPQSSQAALVPLSAHAIPFTAKGKAAYAENAQVLRQRAGKKIERNDMSDCLPYGPTRILQQPFPLQLIQRDDVFVLAYEHNHVYEIVYLGEKPDLERDPAYMGNSVGSWTGDGLLITTNNFKQATLLDDSGLPHSDQLSLTRTLRVLNNGRELEVVSKITDPVMYVRPWSVRQVLKSRPDMHLEEYTCGQGPVLETRYTR